MANGIPRGKIMEAIHKDESIKEKIQKIPSKDFLVNHEDFLLNHQDEIKEELFGGSTGGGSSRSGGTLGIIPAEDDGCCASCDCSSEENPDPHFKTWNGDKYDFHGECDMIHVTNDHLDLHIRTQSIWSDEHSGNGWSGVVLAALRFDDDILEVNALEENAVSVNGDPVTLDTFTLDDVYPVQISTTNTGKKSVKVTMSGGQYIEFLFHLESLVIRMDAHGSDFYGSQGMAGNWNQPGLIGRDSVRSFDLKNERTLYAMQWEVNVDRGDPVLFSTPPIHKCSDVPQAPPMEEKDEARRLVDVEFAKVLCDSIAPEGSEWREDCIFDMIRSNFDEEVLENPTYKDPFTSTERCVAAPEDEKAANADETGLSCAELGGECVYRCNTAEHDCRPDALCVEATDLTVVDVARRRLRKVEFIEGCSCAVPKMKSSFVEDVNEECMDDSEFEFATGDGVRGSSMKTCDWLYEMEGRVDEYCEMKGYDPDATTLIKSACRGACSEYLSECV